MKKQIASLLVAFILCSSLTLPAWATRTEISESSITWFTLGEGESVRSYSREMGWVLVYTGNDIKIGDGVFREELRIIDLKTQAEVREYNFFSSFEEDLAVVGLCQADVEKYGFIDKAGNAVIPLEYTQANGFSEGMAAVGIGAWESAIYGYIDKTGKTIIQPEYDEAGDFFEGLAKVGKKDAYGNLKYGLIDKTGKIVVPLEYDVLGYAANTIDEVTERIYGSVEYDPNQPIRVAKTGSDGNMKYGYIDKSGRELVPIMYDEAYGFVNGLAKVGKKDDNWDIKYGYIDVKGNAVIPMEYDASLSSSWTSPSEQSFIQDLVPIAKRDESSYSGCKFGYADKKGNVVVPLIYDLAGGFTEDGLAPVIIEGEDHFRDRKAGYIDKNGEVVIPLEYTTIGPFCDGVASVGKLDDDGTLVMGAINKTGAVILPFEFETIQIIYNTDPKKDLLMARKNSGVCEFYSMAGEAILPTGYTVSGNINGAYWGRGLIVAKQDGASEWGLYNADGKVVLAQKYDRIEVCGSFIAVEEDGRHGIVDNPYWKETDAQKPRNIPFVFVVAGVAIMAVIIVAIVFATKRKRGVPAMTAPASDAEVLNIPSTVQSQSAPPPAHSSVVPKFCPNCGKPVTSNDKFCSGCGHKIQS